MNFRGLKVWLSLFKTKKARKERRKREKKTCLKIKRPLFNRLAFFMLKKKERRTKGDSSVVELSVKSLLQTELIPLRSCSAMQRLNSIQLSSLHFFPKWSCCRRSLGVAPSLHRIFSKYQPNVRKKKIVCQYGAAHHSTCFDRRPISYTCSTGDTFFYTRCFNTNLNNKNTLLLLQHKTFILFFPSFDATNAAFG